MFNYKYRNQYSDVIGVHGCRHNYSKKKLKETTKFYHCSGEINYMQLSCENIFCYEYHFVGDFFFLPRIYINVT